ncbi:MAG TPA: histidine phosphatase family protein [Chloroflexia bacterium]|nr:histidine phosphatase family protein [Chloroflexia bacterium]
MSKQLYLVRHCRAAGQEPDSPLTPEGTSQAAALARFLGRLPVDRIVSSPFWRARASIMPLAHRLDLPVEIDPRLAERVLAGPDPLPDWRDHLRAGFADPDLCLPGGESSRTAQARGVAALQDILAHPAQHTVVVTHGNLLALLLQHFDGTYGFEAWQRLTNPDVFAVDVQEDAATVRRIWTE